MKKVRVRKVNKKVFYNRLLTLGLCFSLIFVLTSSVVAKDIQPEYKEVLVKQGETLWTIVKSNYNNDVNIEAAIYEIKRINGMKTSYIYSGETLKIPSKI